MFATALVRAAEGDPDAMSTPTQVLIEEPTPDGNRIDLVVVDSERVIRIELKIDAGLDNPLADYARQARDDWSGLSSLNLVVAPDSLCRTLGDLEGGFRALSLQAWAQAVRRSFGNHVSSADPRRLWLAVELLDAMDHYDRTNDMADELILSLADVQDKANAFLGQVRAANRRLWQVAESVKDVAEEAHGSYQWKVYSMAVAWLGASVSTRVRIEEIELDLGLVVQPKGWAIELKPAGSTTASEVAALARRVAPAANWQTAGSRNDLQQSTVDLRFDAPPQDVLACVEPWLARATESSLA